MNNTSKWTLVGALLLAMFELTTPLLAAKETEDQLIADLSAADPDKVTASLAELEDKYPTSTNAFPTIKKLLTDPREKVRRKAARVLGVLHAEVNEDDIKAICALLIPPRAKEIRSPTTLFRSASVLKAPDRGGIVDGLKALRGLKAPSAVPEILPLLRYSNNDVIRDACRTLAVLGNKDLIPSIEPLLQDSDRKVRKDAQDAIDALRAKP